MHVCHIITRLIVGGAQENTILTCRGLVEKGHRVTLIAGVETGPEGSLWDQAAASGAEVLSARFLVRAVRPLSDWKAAKEMEELLRRLRPDIVHTHSSKAGILARRAAHRAGVPAIVHTIHGMSFNRTQPRTVQHLYRRLERRASAYTSAFVCVADAMREQAVASGLGPPEKFVTIRSGVETERFGPSPEARQCVRTAWGVRDHEIAVGTIARLFKNKGYEELMDALPVAIRYQPNLRFVWVGGGARAEAYRRQLARRRLLDRVHLTGLVEPETVPRLLNGFDMLVHASRWEGLPRAVVQALLTEVPAISFDVDGAAEVVQPGQTGLLVPPGDAAGLAAGIVALARNSTLRQRLGRQGRRLCRDTFDWRKMVDQIEGVYQTLVGTAVAGVS